ncbi:MAG: DUF1553 domain-containing protein [bacterium]|nr:DUF1553 domain-containing protein [bacterium]
MKKFCMLSVAAWLALALCAWSADEALVVPPEVQAELERSPAADFNFDVKPILADRCFKCHGPDINHRMVNLRLDTAEGAYGPLLIGEGSAVVPGKPQESEMLRRVLSYDKERVMPPAGSDLTLSAREKAILYRWVEQGGAYKRHWAFIPPEEALAEANTAPEASRSIDAFVQRELQEHRLSFSPEADKETLIRRVTFDLTGLPPTLEEIDAFLADESQDAYEHVVDRLLASPRYGERMAMNWLDVARYADTYGYQADNYRPMWRWRDWVIGAYNRNMPYDRFVEWQLAGDLEPNASQEQILATAFNRNHPQNAEGGIVNEEYQVEYAVDRVDTFGKAFLGVTVQCARCHDHKYDPIKQKEFYQLSSFFNNLDEAGQITWSQSDTPSPSLMLPSDEQKSKLAGLDGEIQTVQARLDALDSRKRDAFEHWLARAKRGEIEIEPRFLQAHYTLDAATNESIENEEGSDTGRIVDPVTMGLAETSPRPVEGAHGGGLLIDGDQMLDFPGVGRFSKAQPFSVGMWVWIPNDLQNGVIFHSNRGGIIYSFKGYQVSIEDGFFDVRLAHVFPGNAIHLVSEETAPRETWTHVMLTYDGSAKAAGVRFYVNGEPLAMKTLCDHLIKDIVFVKDGIGTNLRVGARWRSRGFKDGKIDDVIVYNQALTPLAVKEAIGQHAVRTLIDLDRVQWSEAETEALYAYYLSNFDLDAIALRNRLIDLRAQRAAIEEDVDEIMVMKEASVPRQAYVLQRGVYSARGEAVEPGVIQSVLPYPDDYPKNRLGLARWLTKPDNPLTARVEVNRLWQQCFGRGIVKTAEDFGVQGELPTHPELLDWLAVEFMRSGWDEKAMLKRIVTSRTYRQTSVASAEALANDPENRWLARGPRQRLTAEMLRDAALAAGGLMNGVIGGPSVKPYQPDGLWSFGMNSHYEQDHGDKLYRRSLYTFWKRTVPHPTMNVFDAPDRSYCVVRRQKTNTPLQALTLMNDPQFVEAARALAGRMTAQESAMPDERIDFAFRALTSRDPAPRELDVLRLLYERQRDAFSRAPESAKGWLETGESPRLDTDDDAGLAACAVVASTIVNSDAFIVKR